MYMHARMAQEFDACTSAATRDMVKIGNAYADMLQQVLKGRSSGLLIRKSYALVENIIVPRKCLTSSESHFAVLLVTFINLSLFHLLGFEEGILLNLINNSHMNLTHSQQRKIVFLQVIINHFLKSKLLYSLGFACMLELLYKFKYEGIFYVGYERRAPSSQPDESRRPLQQVQVVHDLNPCCWYREFLHSSISILIT